MRYLPASVLMPFGCLKYVTGLLHQNEYIQRFQLFLMHSFLCPQYFFSCCSVYSFQFVNIFLVKNTVLQVIFHQNHRGLQKARTNLQLS